MRKLWHLLVPALSCTKSTNGSFWTPILTTISLLVTTFYLQRDETMNYNGYGLLPAAVLAHFSICCKNISQNYKSFRQPRTRRWEQTEVMHWRNVHRVVKALSLLSFAVNYLKSFCLGWNVCKRLNFYRREGIFFAVNMSLPEKRWKMTNSCCKLWSGWGLCGLQWLILKKVYRLILKYWYKFTHFF